MCARNARASTRNNRNHHVSRRQQISRQRKFRADFQDALAQPVAKTSSAAAPDARGTRARAFGRSTPASPRVMLRSALLAACAFAACVSPATAYEVLVSEGVVAPRKWVAVASSPALGAGDGSDVAAPVPPVPGLITLAPGGALRVTRVRPSAPAEREPRTEDVRAAVLTLGAVSEFDRPTSGWTLRVDVRSVETVEGVVSAARGGEENAANLANLTRAVKTVERVVTTSCLLRRGSRGAWEVKKDGSVNSERTCTARRGDVFFSQSETKSAEETRFVAAGAAEQKNHDEGTHDETETRIEIALGTDVWHSRRDSDAIPSPFTSPRVENLHTKRVAARRVEEIALVAVPSDDAETYSRHTLAVNTLALLSRDDLVDLAWSWLARATQCASGLRTELVSKCDVGKEGATFSGDAFSFSEKAKGLTVDALVNGCCAAVASYADAECGCALEVAEGIAPFFFGRQVLSSPGESAMARNDDAHAAAATLEALCFGEKDAEQKTSCVSSSATLAATRAVALENVQEEEPKSKARTRAFASSSSPGTGTSPGSSPEEREYVAFKRWLDGADATPLSSTVVDADPDDVVTFGVEGEADAGGSESDAQENANASRTKSPNGRRDEDEDEKKNAFLFFVALVVLASVAAATTLAFFFRRRVFARGCRRDDLFLARANASDDAAFALENGDEVRLVARRRADAGAGGA